MPNSRNLVLLIPDGIQSVTTLEIAQYTGGGFATLASTEYFLRPSLWTLPPGFPYTQIELTNYPTSANTRPLFYDGYANVRVTGVFGWAAVPGVIRGIAERSVVRQFQARGSGNTDTTGNAEFGGSTQHFFTIADKRRLLRLSVEPIAVG